MHMQKKKILDKEYSYTVIYESVKEGGYQVTVPVLPGLVSYGRDFEEARKMARDAIRCYLESFMKEKARIPQETGLLQEKVSISLYSF